MNGQVVGSSKGGRERAREGGGGQAERNEKEGGQAGSHKKYTYKNLPITCLAASACPAASACALLPLLLSTSLSARFLGPPVGASPLICLLGDNQ